ncbi:hypothetical protein [Aquipseudomonas alcaligenes]|uniref:hypothetical protein n=1 Tax=Aquipseudomonas alcaligenes TaxID=43263 RepID=UPI00165A0F3F|nr:hypothetical protein [Pseudomonas alcaligenes]
MARIQIPDNLGECEIIIAKAGHFAVWNHKSGKNRFMVACKSKEQAELLLKKLKEKDHNGEVWL